MSFLHEGIEYLEIPDGLRIIKLHNLQSQELIIPTMVNEKPVVEIWNNAFASTDNLRKVILPHTIYAIRTRAFWNCVDLEEVVCANSSKALGVMRVYEEAFANCRSLQSIYCSKTMQLEGNGHFCFCENLSNISWITGSIHTRSFYGCNKLKKLCMSANLTFHNDTFHFVPHLETLEFRNEYVGKYPKEVLDFMKDKTIVCNHWSELTGLAYQGYNVVIR